MLFIRQVTIYAAGVAESSRNPNMESSPAKKNKLSLSKFVTQYFTNPVFVG